MFEVPEPLTTAVILSASTLALIVPDPLRVVANSAAVIVPDTVMLPSPLMVKLLNCLAVT
ncbi:hypothetical protein D3C80_2186520 [compost metagenome]